VDADEDFEGDHVVIPLIIYLDKTTLDGLGRVSAFPVYLSLGNYSWDDYNSKGGIRLVGLIPNLRPDGTFEGVGWKPKSDAFKDTKRRVFNECMRLIFGSAKDAARLEFDFVDPSGVPRRGVPLPLCIVKDLGEAGVISGCKSNR
jgi:hypothetical protein